MPTPRIKRTRTGNIQGDNVTLDFDAAVVSPDTFRRAINAFLDLVKAVSDEVSGSGKKIQRDIKVATGSRLLIATGSCLPLRRKPAVIKASFLEAKLA